MAIASGARSFSALAEAQRQRQQAQHRRDRRHQDRADPDVPGSHDGRPQGQARRSALVDKVHLKTVYKPRRHGSYFLPAWNVVPLSLFRVSKSLASFCYLREIYAQTPT